MKQKPAGRLSSSEKIIRDIKRKTRKQYSAEEKIRIVLDGLRGEDSIADKASIHAIQAWRVIVTPQRWHFTFSILPIVPNPKVVSMTRKSCHPNQQNNRLNLLGTFSIGL